MYISASREEGFTHDKNHINKKEERSKATIPEWICPQKALKKVQHVVPDIVWASKNRRDGQR